MSTKAQRAAHRDESTAKLKELLKPGTGIRPILRHVSKSGRMRHISFVIVADGEVQDISWHIANVLDYATDDNHALKVTGAGMDMGFHVVYSLSRVLFDDGYVLNSRWL